MSEVLSGQAISAEKQYLASSADLSTKAKSQKQFNQIGCMDK